MRIPINSTAAEAKLDVAVAAVGREAQGAEGDPFDDAMVAAVTGLADALRAESAEFENVRGRMVRLARQAVTT